MPEGSRTPATVLLAHVETWRPYTVFYAGAVSLAGAVLAADALPAPAVLVGAWAAPTLGWIAALYGGDYFDRRLDAIAKPQRPIPSGRMSPAAALAGMAIAIVLGTAIAAALNPLALGLVAAAAALGVAYSAVFKARGGSGNIVRGSLTALAFLFGAVATNSAPGADLLLVALVFWVHDAGSNIVGTVRDLDGDREGGYRTFAVRHGVSAALRVAALVYAAWVIVGSAWALSAPRGLDLQAFGALFAVATAFGATALLTLARAARPIRRVVALRAHEILVVGRLVLACAFIAAAGAVELATTVLAASTIATVGFQAALRRRHELPGETAEPVVDEAALTAFVDAQLATVRGLTSLSGWGRRIEIEVSDAACSLQLTIRHGVLERVDRDAYDAIDLPALRIVTDSRTFRDIFLTGTTNPRRAFIAGRIKLEATPRDLPRLNQVFNEFRRLSGSSARVAVAAGPVPEVVEGRLAPSVVISDTTLRDGEQMPGVAFTPEAKVELARRLDAIGIGVIEVGFPIVSREERAAIREIVALDLEAVIQVIARPVIADIDAALDCGAQSVAVFVGTSDAHVERKLRTTRERLLRQVHDAVAYASQTGCHVVFAAEDATRTPLDFLLEVYRTAAAAGAHTVGIADTAGVAVPAQMSQLVRQVSQATDVAVAVHCHDDLGLATANSLAGLLAGASGAQCSILGIGERAGNAALEELVMILEVGYDHRTGVDLAGLSPLAEHVAGLLGQPVAANKAVVGANAFVHESGLHIDGVIRDPRTYEPYPPELLGRKRRFTFGKHSGKAAIIDALDRHQVAVDNERLPRLLDEVKTRGQAGTPLDELALVRLAGELA